MENNNNVMGNNVGEMTLQEQIAYIMNNTDNSVAPQTAAPQTIPATMAAVPTSFKKIVNPDGSTTTPLPDRKKSKGPKSDLNKWFMLHVANTLAPNKVPDNHTESAYVYATGYRSVDLDKVTFERSNLEVGIVDMRMGAPYATEKMANSIGIVTVDAAVLLNGKPCYNEDREILVKTETFPIFPGYNDPEMINILGLLVPAYQKKLGRQQATKADGSLINRKVSQMVDGKWTDTKIDKPVQINTYGDSLNQTFALPITIQGYAQIYSYVIKYLLDNR